MIPQPPSTHQTTAKLWVLEFFSGLGGWRYALGHKGKVVAALDISEPANETYALNHGESPVTCELASLKLDRLRQWEADTWLMSPPCQPFCRMGNRQDLDDPRSAAFRHLLILMEKQAPERLALENVVGFFNSEAHRSLRALLERLGMHVQEFELCASQFGLPNFRPRVYLLASRRPMDPPTITRVEPAPLMEFLDSEEDHGLYLDEPTLVKHGPGLDLVRPEDRRSACFIGGYGQRFVGSGSFLVTQMGIRRFSPGEIARLLGFPPEFRFPLGLSLEKRYKLLGNSLSLPVAAWVLSHLGNA